MLIFEYKLDGTRQQYAAIDEAIRIVQFLGWMKSYAAMHGIEVVGPATLHEPGLLWLWGTCAENTLDPYACLSHVWTCFGSRRECCCEHPGKSIRRYPGAQGNP